MESTQQAAPFIAQINQAEAKLETISGNDIKETVQRDFLDVAIIGRVHTQINQAETKLETTSGKGINETVQQDFLAVSYFITQSRKPLPETMGDIRWQRIANPLHLQRLATVKLILARPFKGLAPDPSHPQSSLVKSNGFRTPCTCRDSQKIKPIMACPFIGLHCKVGSRQYQI
jgi:hypothetical protein